MTNVGWIKVLDRLDEHNARWCSGPWRRQLMLNTPIIEDDGELFADVELHARAPMSVLANDRAMICGREYRVQIQWVQLGKDTIEQLAMYQKVLDIKVQDTCLFYMKPIPWAFVRQISFVRAWSVPVCDDLRRVVFGFITLQS